MSRRTAVAALLTATALVGFAGCSSRVPEGQDGLRTPGGPSQQVTAALDRAVAAVDATRTELLEAPALVVTAAMALDAADEACVMGGGAAARRVRGPVGAALEDARSAVASVPQRTRASREALTALERSARPLQPAQQAALIEVVTRGRAEVDSNEAFAGVAGNALPAYGAVDEAQSTWLQRVSSGWFRDTAEAADAYAVLVRPQRQELQRARDALAEGDQARRTDSERMRVALSAADAALAPLRTAS